MDFELDESQRLFRETMRTFVEREVVPVASEMERSGEYPTALVEQLKGMGLFGMTVPSEFGGAALDMVSFALAFEELSRGWMGLAGVLGSHSLACFIIAGHGTPEQRQRFLPDLATGKRRTGIALTEPDAGSDLQGITTHAVRDGDDYVVNGVKMWITNARHADPLPILVKTDRSAQPPHRGMSVLLVESGTPGITVSRDLGKLGYKGPETCEVVIEDARVPAGNLLAGEEGHGLQQVLSGLECGRINVAARAVGVAQASYDAALRYSRQRRAFGQPIGDFQAIQLKLADMATEIQAARLLLWWAASILDLGRRADVETGMAKLFASELALRCSLDAMRIHGAYGYSTEFPVERYYRDAPLMAIGEGTNDILRVVIARGLARMQS
jgi:alkylation response protein AidB-like acyl-CoA dehydrogenase